jgi:hypothetical protein
MAMKKKWRKRKETRNIDTWICPWCGAEGAFDDVVYGSDVWNDHKVVRCKSCSKWSFVQAWASWEFVAQPLNGPDDEGKDEY